MQAHSKAQQIGDEGVFFLLSELGAQDQVKEFHRIGER
jgi:hypothetical protein